MIQAYTFALVDRVCLEVLTYLTFTTSAYVQPFLLTIFMHVPDTLAGRFLFARFEQIRHVWFI